MTAGMAAKVVSEARVAGWAASVALGVETTAAAAVARAARWAAWAAVGVATAASAVSVEAERVFAEVAGKAVVATGTGEAAGSAMVRAAAAAATA